MESPPSKGAGKGSGVLFPTPLANSCNISGSKWNGEKVDKVGRPKRLRVGEQDEQWKELPGRPFFSSVLFVIYFSVGFGASFSAYSCFFGYFVSSSFQARLYGGLIALGPSLAGSSGP